MSTDSSVTNINSPALPAGSVRIPKYMLIALGELGQKEVAGAADNPRIVEYHSATSYKATDDETPWCSSFVNWVMKQAGIARTNSAAALQWRDWGMKIDPKKMKYGDVLVWNHGHGRGHVAFFVGRADNGDILALGGNQSNSVNIGRFTSNVPVEVRRPKSVADSTTVWNGAIGAASIAASAAITASTPTSAVIVTPASAPTSNANADAVHSLPNGTVDFEFAVDPAIGDAVAAFLPPHWAGYVPLAIAAVNFAHMIYRRIRRLHLTNI